MTNTLNSAVKLLNLNICILIITWELGSARNLHVIGMSYVQ